MLRTIPKDDPRKFDTLFVSMPFGPLTTPSIALGLLKSILCQNGMDSKALYFNLELACRLQPAEYQLVAIGEPETLVGEWIFSNSLFGEALESARDPETFLKKAFEMAYDDNLLPVIKKIQGEVDEFLEDCLAEVLRYTPKVVGFTSNFQQQLASLCLAKRIKEANPAIKIVFGGANLEGNMGVEMVRQFPFVDVVVSGEADLIVVDLFQRLLEGRPCSDIEGVYTQDNVALQLIVNGTEAPIAPQVREMDNLPYPDYGDFFDAFQRMGWTEEVAADPNLQPRVLIQTARGCWWGDIQHCSFCPINDLGINYRSMSYPRALEEILYVVAKYPGLGISFVDYILDMRYFKELLPKLIELDLQLDLFYEVKANLRREQVRMLKQAGVHQVQPGIESFSDHVLELIGKGVTGLQNIQTLKWCREFDVSPSWSILWGFPGETKEDHARVAEILPNVFHLRPPEAAVAFRMDRFGPNFAHAQKNGFVDVTPFPAYAEVYPTLTNEARFNLAYYFSYGYRGKEDVSTETARVADLVAQWKADQLFSALFFLDKEDFLLVCDTRLYSKRVFHQIAEPMRTVYLFCDTLRTMRQLQKQLTELEINLSEQELRAGLQPLVDAGLMLHDPAKDLFLSLAISGEFFQPSREILERMYSLALANGELSEEQLPA